jgi:L-alanine-DL-glutamate epimerase-like enolase superfamily enzyme
MADEMRIVDFIFTRFQFARDRVIGDSQIASHEVQAASLELLCSDGTTGLGFMNSVMASLPDEAEIARVFALEAWAELEGQIPAALAHRQLTRRGGNRRKMSLPFEDAIQQAVWDLYAKSTGLPLWKLMGGVKEKVRVYASGLDFHLSDGDYCRLFAKAAEEGHTAFKIKVGHPDIERDIHRLDLLKSTVGSQATVMVDANEAWTPKQALRALESYRKAGHEIYWVEDPILRDDIAGLTWLRRGLGTTYLNSGEYLDVLGKRALIDAGAADIINVGGQIADVMRLGWYASDKNVELALGNTFLEVGVNLAIALPEVRWLEYSYQNLEHLVETSFTIRDGYIFGGVEAGHGLTLSEEARTQWREPSPILDSKTLAAPPQVRLAAK